MKRNSIGKTLRLLVVLAALLCIVFAGYSLAEKAEQVETAERTKVRIEDRRGISNAEAAEQYMYQLLGWEEQVKALPPLRRGNTAGNTLPTVAKKLYDEMKVKVQAVASGSLASTVFSFELNKLFPDGCTAEELGITDTVDLGDAIFQHVSNALAALMEDCPYELYWYDKTIGVSYSLGGGSVSSLNDTYSFGDGLFLTIRCYVSKDYAESGTQGTTQTKASFPEKVSKAAANAKKIVANNAGKSDYYKLMAYKEAICGLTDYNHYAANNNIAYGDPWQLIYVFDGEPETTVVCEGYSKAFQYLCDLSAFRSKSTKAISVSGYMWETGDSERGRHMWNIVTLNGNRYLADITNSDSSSVGWDGTLFLTGYAEYNEKDDYYRYDVNKTVNGSDIDIIYSYTRETLSAFSENLDELETAGTPYANIIATGDCSADGEGNQVTWTLYDSGLLTISGTGKIKNYIGAGDSPFYNDYKNKITSVFIGEGVTNIGGYLLYGQEKLEEISLPDSLTEIGTFAFGNCSGLSEIDIPDGVTTIGYATFNGCTGLTVINIPETVTTINVQAFYNCSGLKSIRLPKELQTLKASTFTLCSQLKSITLPVSVTAIEEGAFSSCNSLTDVYYCGTVSQKNNISISDNNNGNYSLQNAAWHYTDGSCGPNAYWFLSTNGEFSNVVITGNGEISDIDYIDEERQPWSYQSTLKRLESATIENGITVLGKYAFAECSDLRSVSLPESLLEIGEYAFYRCSKLTEVVIPDSVTSIKDYAFAKCTYLESITIPGMIYNIGEHVFSDCTNLANIWFGGTREAWNSLSQNLSLSDSVTVHCADDETAQATWDWEIPIGRPDVLILKGTGKVSLAEGETAYPWSTMIGQIKRVIVEEGITELGPRVLDGCNPGLRVDFLGNHIPTIAANAFGYNSAVCRYFTSGGNWSTGISNVNSIYLPFQPDDVDALEIRYTKGNKWVVDNRTQSGESSTEVTAEQAMELTFDDRWVVLDTIPTEKDDLDVFMGLDAPTVILVSDSCDDAGPAALDFSAQNTDNLKTVETYAKNLKLAITGPGIPAGSKAPNVIIHEGNTFNYNGSINKLTLNTTQHSNPAVIVTGGVKELVFHDASDDRPYKGSLTVSGTIDLVTAHGQDSLFIPGLSANGEDPVPLNNMPLRTYANVTQEDPVVTLFTEGDKKESRLTISGQEAQVQKWTAEDCRFAYHIYDDRISFDLIPKQPEDAQPIGYIFDILGRGYNPNFTTADIYQGADTTVYVENTGANNENYDPVIKLGNEDQANQTGIGTLYLENCRVEINYPVAQVMVWQEASRSGPVFAEINSTVNEIGLLLSRAGGKIEVGENGVINSGYWDRGVLGWRIFGKVIAGETLAENGRLCVMSAKSGQTLKAILPSDAAVTSVAAVTADGSAVPANYHAVLDVDQKEISAVTGEDATLLNTYLTNNNLTNDNVWAVMDVTVNACPIIGEGEEKTVNTLSSGVPVSIENKAGSTATVLRLHDGTLTELPNSSQADGVYDFTSDKFSTYVLVSTTTCCTHPQTSTRTSWKDGTVITSVNDVDHHVTGIRIIEEYCSNCNEVLGTTEEPVDGDFAHYYQQDGDSQTEVTYQWINAEQHKKTTVTITSLECAECGHTISQRSAPVYDDPEGHTDENQDDFCDDCGVSISEPWVAEGNWVLDTDDAEGNVLYINGSGKMPDYPAGSAPWNSAATGKAIDRIVIAEGITRIGTNAFANLSGVGDEPVRIEFLDWSKTKSRKMPAVSVSAFTGTNVICRYYSMDASWAKGIANRTENWIYLPWYEAQTPGKLPVCYGYVKNTGYTWHIQQESGDIPLTLEQAREITYKYRFLDLFVLPDPQGTDDELYTNSTVPVYLTVNVDEQGTLELNATTGASLTGLELMSPKLNMTVTRAENKTLNYVAVHAGTLTVNGSINQLELTNSGNSAGNVTVNGDVAQLDFDGPQSSEEDIYRGDLKVKGKILYGYEYGSGKLSITPFGEVDLTGMVCKKFSLDTDAATQVVQDGSLVLTGDNVTEYATKLSDYMLTYQFFDDKTNLVLEPKLVGNRCELNLTEKIREKENDPTADFDPDNIIWGEDTEVDVHFWTTPKTLTLNGGENGTAGFARLFINATVGTVNLNCPVGSLTVAHDFYRGASNALTLNINSTVEDADFAFSGSNNLVTLGAQGKLKGGIWKKFQHARRTIPLVNGSCTLVKDGQLCILAAQENETMKAILPGDSALKRAAGQDAIMSITESGRGLQEAEQEALDLIKGDGNIVTQVFEVFVYDGEFNSLNELNSNARMAVENDSGGSAYVVRFHDYNDGKGLMAETVSQPTTGDAIWFESDVFSTFAVIKGTPSACAGGHTLTKVDAVSATCTLEGTKAHFKCSVCGKLFADENGTAGAEITNDQDLIIPAAGHEITAVAAVPATCIAEGTAAYWRCSICGELFFNEAGTQVATANALVLPIDTMAHNLEHHQAVPATTSEEGCNEHWECTLCHKLFLDEEGKVETTADDLTIPTVDQNCGDSLTWEYNETTQTLTISGTGPMYDYCVSNDATSHNPAPWYSVRTQIITVVIDSGATTVGEYAFSGCTAMTNITIPESVTDIGENAFSGCSNLTVYYDGTAEIALPEGSGLYRSITVEASENGTVTASQGWASEGDNISLTVVADEGYQLDTLVVKDRDNQTVNQSVQYFLMPDSKVTVTATFSQIPAFTFTPVISPASLQLTYGHTTGDTLTVTADVPDGYTLVYQWYERASANADGQQIAGETSVSYTIPSTLTAGTTKYYYCQVTASKDDTIATADSGNAVVTIGKANPTYTDPSFTISYAPGNTLSQLSFTNPDNGTWSWIAAGSTPLGNVGVNTYMARFTPTDTTNYNTIENIAVPVEVTRAPVSYDAPYGKVNLTYNGQAQDLVNAGVQRMGTEGANWRFLYSTTENGEYSATVPQGTNAGNYSVWWKLETDANHVSYGPTEISGITIAQRQVIVTGLSAVTKEYDETTNAVFDDSYVKFYLGSIDEENELAISHDDLSVSATASFTSANAGTYDFANFEDVELTGNKAANYRIASIQGYHQVQITKANQDAPAAPTMASNTLFSITLNEVEGCVYSINDTNYQSSTVFDNLEMDTPYTFYQYKPEDANHNASPKASATIRTAAHTHQFEYIVSEQSHTIYVRCVNDDGVHVTVDSYTCLYTLYPPALTAYGGSGSANATYRKEGLAKDDLPNPEVVYRKGTTVLTGAPTEAGEYTASISIVDGNNTYTTSVPYTIQKAQPVLSTAPAAVSNLVYNGQNQALVTEGTVTGGTIQYAMGLDIYPTGEWSTTVPTMKDANVYHVWYRVIGDNNHCDLDPAHIRVEIGEAAITNASVTITGGRLTFNGNNQRPNLNKQPTTQYGDPITYTYKKSGDNFFNNSSPAFVSAGTHRVYYKAEAVNYTAIEGNDTNGLYYDVVIDPAPLTVTAKNHTIYYGQAPANNGVEYTGMFELLPPWQENQITYTYNYTQGNDAGSYSITPGGVSNNNYTITFTPGTLTVQPLDISSAVITLDDALTYTGAERTQGIASVKLGDYDVTYTISGNKGTDANTYTLTLTGTGNFTGTAQKTWTIAPKSVTANADNIILNYASFTYDGTPKQPDVAVKDGETVIPADEYTVGYSNNTNAGTATVTITDKEGGNYAVSGSRTFTIGKAASDVSVHPTAVTGLVTDGQSHALVSAGIATGGTLLYKLDGGAYSETIPTASAAGNYRVYYKVDGGTNYNGKEDANWYVDVTIAQSYGITVGGETVTSANYTEKLGVAAGGVSYDASTGTLTINANAAPTGNVTIPSGTKVVVASGAKLTVSENNTLTVAASASLTNNGTINGAGTVTNNGSFTNSGNVVGSVTVNNNGTLVNNGDIAGSATVSNGSGGTFTNNGNVNGSATLTNAGSMTNTGDIELGNTFSNSGTLANSGKLGSGIVNNTGTLTNNQQGQITCNVNNQANATVTNKGSITGTVTNRGTITNEAGAIISHTKTTNEVGGTIKTDNGDGTITTQYRSSETFETETTVQASGNQYLIKRIEKEGSTQTVLWGVNMDKAMAHGKVSAGKDAAQEGSEITLTVTPDNGYLLESLTVKDLDGTAVALNGTSFTMPGKAVLVSAAFRLQTFTITWKMDNGSVIDTTTVGYGTVPSHAAPAKAEDSQYTYTFSGWNPSPAAATANVTYTAVFAARAKSAPTPTPTPTPAPAPTEPPEPADKVAAFVTRCYRVILGREPEQAGLDYWVENLKSGKEKASEIINGFVTSQEFRNKHLTDEDAVEILYKAMLGRASDEGGKNYWLSVLNGGNPFAAVINGFCTSKEFNNLCASYGIQPGSVKTGPLKPPKPVKNMTKIRAFVTRCYQVILSRDPEAEGLEYWAKSLASGEREAAEIIDGFVNSREYTNKRLGYADSVEVLYNAMLGRNSEPEGKAYWIKQLEAGKPFAAIINGFCTSKEFKNLCDQYGITPGSVKTSDKVKGTFTAATSKTGPAKETRQMSEAKLADFVRRIYAAALGREPGDGEAEYWVWQLKELRIAPADAAKGILTSGEFRSRGIGGEQLIRILYRVYANRDADEAGLAFWLAKLEAGASPEELMDDFGASAEFKNILRTFWE